MATIKISAQSTPTSTMTTIATTTATKCTCVSRSIVTSFNGYSFRENLPTDTRTILDWSTDRLVRNAHYSDSIVMAAPQSVQVRITLSGKDVSIPTVASCIGEKLRKNFHLRSYASDIYRSR